MIETFFTRYSKRHGGISGNTCKPNTGKTYLWCGRWEISHLQICTRKNNVVGNMTLSIYDASATEGCINCGIQDAAHKYDRWDSFITMDLVQGNNLGLTRHDPVPAIGEYSLRWYIKHLRRCWCNHNTTYTDHCGFRFIERRKVMSDDTDMCAHGPHLSTEKY